MSELGDKAKCDVCCYLYHVVKPTRAEPTAKVVALVLAIPAQQFKTGIKKDHSYTIKVDSDKVTN